MLFNSLLFNSLLVSPLISTPRSFAFPFAETGLFGRRALLRPNAPSAASIQASKEKLAARQSP
jgi:hypothetical protein